MSKKEKRLYIALALFFTFYVVVVQYTPEPLVWVPTFSQKDKQPYGGYVLYDRLEDFFDAKKLSFQTIYEHGDSLNAQMIILASSFEPSAEDVEVLMSQLEQGNDVLIAATYFSKSFQDTLQFGLGEELESATVQIGDSISVSFDEEKITYPASLLASAFDLEDSAAWGVGASVDKPILIYKDFGSGRLILSTLPLAFTNYGLLKEGGVLFPAHALNLMDRKEVIYNRYYHSGRLESQTPFRYLISQPALRWALNLTLAGILILLIIGSRRKQAKIELMDPKSNTTMHFIKTMGGLYLREGKHENVARKLVSHFHIELKEKYYLTRIFDDATFHSLAMKTGQEKSEVIKTFELIQYVRNGASISEEKLTELNERIQKFNLK